MAKQKERSAPRINLRVTVKAEYQSRLQEFYSRNLSAGGIFLEVEQDLPKVGTKLKLKFEVPGLRSPIEVEAEVLHHHSYETMDEKMQPLTRRGIGLHFLNLEDPARQLLDEYVKGRELHVSPQRKS